MRIKVNDVALSFDVDGQRLSPSGTTVIARKTILLLHGGPGMDHMVFKPAFDRLSQNAQVVYLDHRACGRSDDGPAASWRMDQWADDIADFIDQLGIESPIVLGTSWGGLVAQHFATKYPTLPGGIVLMSTAAHPNLNKTFDAMEACGGAAAREAAQAFFADATQQGVVERYFSTCLPYFTFRRSNPEILSRVSMRPEVITHFYRKGSEFYDIDFRDRLARIRVPTLIVHGVNDALFPIDLAEETFKHLVTPHKRLVRIPECGHLSEQDAPEVIMDAIIDFFELKR